MPPRVEPLRVDATTFPVRVEQYSPRSDQWVPLAAFLYLSDAKLFRRERGRILGDPAQFRIVPQEEG